MADDIQFGDMEEARPDRMRRPDKNSHFACVPVHRPKEEDLLIYVDVDVMLEMERHALSDTSVELGGVLLGGQYEDEDGRPFVVVSDALKAEHYQATKGSFKFTHDTWEQISRQREKFPEETKMVGWYHTHPDWGVFLSGMDMFICNHFFNRDLDLALVIDPCRGDRGWFQWKGQGSRTCARTGGFYLYGSRHRKEELEILSEELTGSMAMSTGTRNTNPPRSAGGAPPSVVQIPSPNNPVMEFGIISMLAVQFIFLALISWKIFSPATPPEANNLIEEKLAKIEKSMQTISGSERLAAKTSDMVQRLIDANPEFRKSLADEFVKESVQREQLENALGAASYAASVRESEIKLLTSKLEESQKSKEELKGKFDDLASSNKEMSDSLKKQKELAEGKYRWWADWKYLVAILGTCVISIAAGVWLAKGMPSEERFSSNPSTPSPDSPLKLDRERGEGNEAR